MCALIRLCFIITSGAGQRTKPSLKGLYEAIVNQEDTSINEFSFNHHDWTYKRNYCSLDIKVVDKETIVNAYFTIAIIYLNNSI